MSCFRYLRIFSDLYFIKAWYTTSKYLFTDSIAVNIRFPEKSAYGAWVHLGIVLTQYMSTIKTSG